MNSWLIHAGIEQYGNDIHGDVITKNHHKWPDSKIDVKRKNTKEGEIVELHKMGRSKEEIMQFAGVSYSYVNQIFFKYGFANRSIKRKTRRVLQLDLSGRLIEDFESAKHAAKKTGLHENHIRNVCNPNVSTQKTAGGFFFKYKGIK